MLLKGSTYNSTAASTARACMRDDPDPTLLFHDWRRVAQLLQNNNNKFQNIANTKANNVTMLQGSEASLPSITFLQTCELQAKKLTSKTLRLSSICKGSELLELDLGIFQTLTSKSPRRCHGDGHFQCSLGPQEYSSSGWHTTCGGAVRRALIISHR